MRRELRLVFPFLLTDLTSIKKGSERAYLKSREHSLDLDSKLGKTQVVTPSEIETGSAAPGWWCEVCKCLLKDSTSYLDHINGKKRKNILYYFYHHNSSLEMIVLFIKQIKEL